MEGFRAPGHSSYRGGFNGQYNPRFQRGGGGGPTTGHYIFQPRPPAPVYQATEFDGKRLRKAIARKTVDYNTSVVKMLESRVWQASSREKRLLQPDVGYYTELLPPLAMLDNAVNCITTKFVRTSTNKMRCPIFCVLWTPEGRRLVTGASSGEFTLWNGLTFNFETILQAHDSPVRVMNWSSSDSWMVTADHGGYVKYWQSNMNNVKMFQAHKEAVRALSFCPTDMKFATCSDDGTIRIWDFLRCAEEQVLRGHGSDVKGVDWHPTKSLIVSGSKDSQQPIKLWDPKSGQSLATIHAHKNTVTDVKWNKNGNWLLTSSRDHLIKIFDIRNMSQEVQIFRGHKKEASCLAWHPVHETMFASGGSDGSILFWSVGTEKEVGGMEQAHDGVVWSLSWHPLGHILASGSNDHTCKFWTRNRPGDRMRDKYNLNLIPKGQEEAEYDEIEAAPAIPGFGENVDTEAAERLNNTIPGFGIPDENITNDSNQYSAHRKVPFSKPVPKKFEEQWSDSRGPPQKSDGPRPNFNQARPPMPMGDGMPRDFNRMEPPFIRPMNNQFPENRMPPPPPNMRPNNFMMKRNSPLTVQNDIPFNDRSGTIDRDERVPSQMRDEDLRRLVKNEHETRHGADERPFPDQQEWVRQQRPRFDRPDENWRQEDDERWQREEWSRPNEHQQPERGNGNFNNGDQFNPNHPNDNRQKRPWRDGPGVDQPEPFDPQWNRAPPENRDFNRRY